MSSALEGTQDERVRFAVSNLIDAAAPSNNPLLNPAALKELVDTGGASAVRGVAGIRHRHGGPATGAGMVEPDAFEVGRDLGITSGPSSTATSCTS